MDIQNSAFVTGYEIYISITLLGSILQQAVINLQRCSPTGEICFPDGNLIKQKPNHESTQINT